MGEASSRRSELIDLEMHIHHTGAMSLMVSENGDRESAVFLPLSQIEYRHKGRGIVEVTLPEWLAKDRGLI